MKCKLNTVCNFINGGSWSEKEYSTIGIPVLKVSNLQPDGIDFSNVAYIPEESLVKYFKHQLQKNDLVIATVGSHPTLVNSAAGRAIIIPKQAEGYLLNQNAVCLRTADSNLLDQKFLAYTGKTSIFQNYIQQRGAGAANQMRIAIGAIKEYEISLPPIATQQKIVSILSTYDDLIANNQKRIKLLEEMARITYEEWFIRFRIDGKNLKIKNELPVSWSNVPLGRLIQFVKGRKANDITDEYKEGYKKLLLLDGIESGNYPYANPINQIVAIKDDLLMLMDGARSSKVFFADDGIVGSTMAKLVILDPEISSTLLKCYFDSHFEIMQVNNTGAAIPHANKSFISQMIFKMPSRDILNKWKEFIDPVYELINNLKRQNHVLKEARDILLPRLINGSIDVSSLNEKSESKVIPIQKEKQREASWEFKEAVLISVLTDKFSSQQYPLGRKRYTKLSYLFHRHAEEQVQNYLRKAAGPYNPKTKYQGPEKIAHDNGYVVDHQNGKLTGFVTGNNIAAARTYFENYWNIDYINWLETNFKYKSNDELELYATVDNAMLELYKKNKAVTVPAIKEIIKTEKEWKAKLDREIFSDVNIQKAINYLPTLFQYQ